MGIVIVFTTDEPRTVEGEPGRQTLSEEDPEPGDEQKGPQKTGPLTRSQ